MFYFEPHITCNNKLNRWFNPSRYRVVKLETRVTTVVCREFTTISIERAYNNNARRISFEIKKNAKNEWLKSCRDRDHNAQWHETRNVDKYVHFTTGTIAQHPQFEHKNTYSTHRRAQTSCSGDTQTS